MQDSNCGLDRFQFRNHRAQQVLRCRAGIRRLLAAVFVKPMANIGNRAASAGGQVLHAPFGQRRIIFARDERGFDGLAIWNSSQGWARANASARSTATQLFPTFGSEPMKPFDRAE